MRTIQLTQGQFAIVDDEDYEEISEYTWSTQKGVNTLYANTNVWVGNRYNSVGMHRFVNRTPDGMHTDHIDGNGLNNVKSNLRTVTRTQNAWNRSPNRFGTSEHKGVYWDKQKQKWRSSIRINKRLKHIGLFSVEEDAACAYASAAREHFGEFYRITKGATQ